MQLIGAEQGEGCFIYGHCPCVHVSTCPWSQTSAERLSSRMATSFLMLLRHLCLHVKELGGLQLIRIQIMIVYPVFALFWRWGIKLKSTSFMTDVLVDH